MKRKITIIAAVIMAVVSLAGCGKKATIHPIDIDGTTIDVNKTTVQALYDGGFEITSLGETNEAEAIPSDFILDAESVYEGFFFGKNGELWGSLKVVTEAACEAGKGVICNVNILEQGVSHAKLAGVALTDLTPEKALELISGLKDSDDRQSCITDETILHIYRSEGAKGNVIKLEQEYQYEIDDSQN